MEREIASVIKFVLDNAGANVNPYYYDVPESFSYPAAYFPQPEITTRGDTLNTFACRYAFYPVIFSETTVTAYELARSVLQALKEARNLVPIISDRVEDRLGSLRTYDPKIKAIDRGAVQLTLEWDSRRPYKNWDDCVGEIANILQTHLVYSIKES